MGTGSGGQVEQFAKIGENKVPHSDEMAVDGEVTKCPEGRLTIQSQYAWISSYPKHECTFPGQELINRLFYTYAPTKNLPIHFRVPQR